MVVRRIDELDIDPDAFAFPANTTFEDGRHVEGFPDLPDIMSLSPIRQHRGSRDHLQGAYLRQVRQDVVLDAVGKKSVFRVAAEICEGQNGDGLLEVPLRNA